MASPSRPVPGGPASPFELSSSAPARTALSGSTAPAVDASRFQQAVERSAAPLPDAETKEPQPGRFGGRGARVLVHLGVWVLVAVLAAVLLRVFVVQPYYIPSGSMEPTLHGCDTNCNDDHVLVDKISYRIHGPRQRDIVVFHRPSDVSSEEIHDKVLIKRVIATGGHQVVVKQGHVYVDGRQLEESYVKKTASCPQQSTQPQNGTTSWRVPHGDVFVMGDNRCDSIDSRSFGPIPDSSIIGRAFMKIWPLSKFGFLSN